MKRFALALLKSLPALLILTACGSGDQSFTLKGKYKNLQSGDFYVFSTDPSWQGFDTVHVDEGKFQYSRPINDTLVLTIQYPNFMQMQVVVAPGATTTIKGDANNLLKTKIGGLEDNERLSEFRLSTVGKNEGEVLQLAEDFITRHPASFVSLALLQKHFLSQPEIDYKRVGRMLDRMVKATPRRPAVKRLHTEFQALAQCAPGKKLPKFSALTDAGIRVDNATFRGKHLVIWFWAMWNAEMAYPVTHVRQLMKNCNGQLQALNVCLDADTATMHRVMKRDSLTAHIVCDRLEWNSPLVRAFGVRDVPSAILVDPAGTVIARDLNEEALEKKLETIGLKKSNK